MPQAEFWTHVNNDPAWRVVQGLNVQDVKLVVAQALEVGVNEVGVVPFEFDDPSSNMGDVNCFVWGGGEWTEWSKKRQEDATAEIHAGLASIFDRPELTLVVELIPIPGNTFKIGPAGLPTEPGVED